MGAVMMVDADRLSETPKAFQDYVIQYFSAREVLGRRVLIAAQCLFWDAWKVRTKGTAPSHSVDLMYYKDGLADGQSLNDWMRKAEGTFLWMFYSSEDRGHDNVIDED